MASRCPADRVRALGRQLRACDDRRGRHGRRPQRGQRRARRLGHALGDGRGRFRTHRRSRQRCPPCLKGRTRSVRRARPEERRGLHGRARAPRPDTPDDRCREHAAGSQGAWDGTVGRVRRQVRRSARGPRPRNDPGRTHRLGRRRRPDGQREARPSQITGGTWAAVNWYSSTRSSRVRLGVVRGRRGPGRFGSA
jgi:hypothetical protein